MDGYTFSTKILTFTANIVQAVAWPVCVAVVCWWFRGNIAHLLGRISEISVPGGGKILCPGDSQIREIKENAEKVTGKDMPYPALESVDEPSPNDTPAEADEQVAKAKSTPASGGSTSNTRPGAESLSPVSEGARAEERLMGNEAAIHTEKRTWTRDAAVAQYLLTEAQKKAESEPTVAILYAWDAFTRMVWDKSKRRAGVIDVNIRNPLFSVICNHLPPELWDTAKDMQRIRNETVHAKEPTVTTQGALDYIRLAEIMLANLK